VTTTGAAALRRRSHPTFQIDDVGFSRRSIHALLMLATHVARSSSAGGGSVHSLVGAPGVLASATARAGSYTDIDVSASPDAPPRRTTWTTPAREPKRSVPNQLLSAFAPASVALTALARGVLRTRGSLAISFDERRTKRLPLVEGAGNKV
jgi:hypothetical protein